MGTVAEMRRHMPSLKVEYHSSTFCFVACLRKGYVTATTNQALVCMSCCCPAVGSTRDRPSVYVCTALCIASTHHCSISLDKESDRHAHRLAQLQPLLVTGALLRNEPLNSTAYDISSYAKTRADVFQHECRHLVHRLSGPLTSPGIIQSICAPDEKPIAFFTNARLFAMLIIYPCRARRLAPSPLYAAHFVWSTYLSISFRTYGGFSL